MSHYVQSQKENQAPALGPGGRPRRQKAGRGGHSARMLAVGNVSIAPNAPVANPRRDEFDENEEGNQLAPIESVNGRKAAPMTGQAPPRLALKLPSSPSREQSGNAGGGQPPKRLPARQDKQKKPTENGPARAYVPLEARTPVHQKATQPVRAPQGAGVHEAAQRCPLVTREQEMGNLSGEKHIQDHSQNVAHTMWSGQGLQSATQQQGAQPIMTHAGQGFQGRNPQGQTGAHGPTYQGFGQGFSQGQQPVAQAGAQNGRHAMASTYNQNQEHMNPTSAFNGPPSRTMQGEFDGYFSQQNAMYEQGVRPTPIDYEAVKTTQANGEEFGNGFIWEGGRNENQLDGDIDLRGNDEYPKAPVAFDDEFDAAERAEMEADPHANEEEEVPAPLRTWLESDDNNNVGDFGELVKDDVLADHRRRNRASQAPSLEKLGSHREGEGSRKRKAPADDADDSSDSDYPPRKKKWSRTAQSLPKPHQLKAFASDIVLHSLAKYAKRRFRLVLATEKAFLDKKVADDWDRVRAMVQVIFEERKADVRDAFINLVKLLLNDQSSFRGRVKEFCSKELAVQFRETLGMAPEDIATKIAQLVKTGDWIYSRDSGSESIPFSHPAIEAVVLKYFYMEQKSLARQFPDEFQAVVPYNVVALVATALYCCLEEYTTGRKVAIIFETTKYDKVYKKFQHLLYSIRDGEARASRAFRSMLEEWAAKGMKAIDKDVALAVDVSQLDNYIKPRNW